MLVDSGANISILSKKTIDNLPYSSRPKIHPVQTSLITVTGESSPFEGKIEVDVLLGRQKIVHEFLIADIKQDGILGIDFLMMNSCDIFLSKGYMNVHGEKVPCFLNRSETNCCRIALAETVEVPPESEIIVQGKPLDAINRNSVGILEPVEKFVERTGLMVAKLLVDPAAGNVPIRIANFQKEPCIIYENTVTAVYEHVNVNNCELVGHVGLSENDNENCELPEYLRDMFDRSSLHLDENQKNTFKTFLVFFQVQMEILAAPIW